MFRKSGTIVFSLSQLWVMELSKDEGGLKGGDQWNGHHDLLTLHPMEAIWSPGVGSESAQCSASSSVNCLYMQWDHTTPNSRRSLRLAKNICAFVSAWFVVVLSIFCNKFVKTSILYMVRDLRDTVIRRKRIFVAVIFNVIKKKNANYSGNQTKPIN
jgi:hypothetical protein